MSLIKSARSTKQIQQPHSWQNLHNGQWVFDTIQMRMDEWSPKLFGYHLLKLGGLSCELSMTSCPISHQVHLDVENPLRNIEADAFNLPFVEKSFDAVVLTHQLDYCQDPHRLLREVDRVVMDDGYIILTGFNPISLTGIARLLPWCKHHLPWSGRMFSSYRIKDWLELLNYQVIHCDQYGLLLNRKERMIWTWMENILGDWMAPFGSVYFIVARKRTYPLKPIKPHWKLKEHLSPLKANYNANSNHNIQD